MEVLDTLNPKQKEAVLATEGPVLVLAGAGSGKTKTLTHRIAYLIREKKVSTWNILAVTFTNKAAQEMAIRVAHLLSQNSNPCLAGRQVKPQKYGAGSISRFPTKSGMTEDGREANKLTSHPSRLARAEADNLQPEIRLPWLGTFHSICVRILRREAGRIGYRSSFTIYDDSDQKSLIKRVMREQNIDPKDFNPSAIMNFISGAKNELIDYKEYKKYVNSPFEEVVSRVYVKYQNYLKDYNAMDFDDLIMNCVRLFQQEKQVLEYYQSQFKYILIDEYQDTNQAQYMWVKLLAEKHKNIMVVGDDYQCLLPQTKINLEKCSKKIVDVKKGDSVIAATGWGGTGLGTVERNIPNKFKGSIVEIETTSGKRLSLTPEHKIFARLQTEPNKYYVYLMYRTDKGYRIGITSGVRSRKGEIVNGLMVRINQESADKIWILESCKSLEDALYLESYFAYKYGIPTMVFSIIGRHLKWSQEKINQLFDQIDTRERAKILASDIDIDLAYPHWVPQAITRNNSCRKIINLSMFGEDRAFKMRNWHAHRVCLNTTDKDLRGKLTNIFNVRDGQRGTWRVETSRRNYEDAKSLCSNLQSHDESLAIYERARLLLKDSHMIMPAKNLRAGMMMPVLEKDIIAEEEVKIIKRVDYHGEVYDLDVENLHNYSANGIIVHNSIYGWRGANFKNILNFEKHYPGAKIIKLEQNYRSTETILNAANEVIKYNRNRTDKILWTENQSGTPITVYEALNEKDEAEFVITEIKSLSRKYDLSNFAVLYRTNAQSRSIEEALMRFNMPYRIFGGVKFYQRKEIKDIISYLRLIANPADRDAMERAVGAPPRGIGEKTLALMSNIKAQMSNEIQNLNNQKIIDFVQMIDDLRTLSEEIELDQLIQSIAIKSGYKKWILDGTPEGEGRWENVLELAGVAAQVQEISKSKSQNDSGHPVLDTGSTNSSGSISGFPIESGMTDSPEPTALETFLERVALIQDMDSFDPNQSAVTLMTLHSAKGLEFENVFIVGMEEGIFPHSRSQMDESELEEERRLCYVGITRAKKRLYLIYASERNIYGRFQANPRSRFIEHIPEYLLDVI